MLHIGWDLSYCADLTVMAIRTPAELLHLTWFEMDRVYFENGRRQGTTELWAKQLRLALKARPDNQLIIVCSNQKSMLNTLNIHFPDALFELVGTYGIKVHLRG